MIRYALACDAGHRFETWFRDSDSYETQIAAHLVECPTCQSASVAKTIMAPAIVSSRASLVPVSDSVASAPAAPPVDGPILDGPHAEARAMLRAIRAKAIADGDDVGTRFPEEARRMHEGAIPTRQIYGQASRDEAVALLDDGILVMPLPGLPEELN